MPSIGSYNTFLLFRDLLVTLLQVCLWLRQSSPTRRHVSQLLGCTASRRDHSAYRASLLLLENPRATKRRPCAPLRDYSREYLDSCEERQSVMLCQVSLAQCGAGIAVAVQANQLGKLSLIGENEIPQAVGVRYRTV